MYKLVRRFFGTASPPPVPPPEEVLFRPHALTGTFFISGPRDDQSVLEEIRHSHEFEPHVIGLLPRVVKPDAIVLDVGANVGVLSVVFAELAPRGRIYAFEASQVAYDHLVRTLRANGVANVDTARKAVFDRSGLTLRLNTSTAFLAGSYLDPASDVSGSHEDVGTVTVDDWVRERGLPRVDFIKMDIEGSELSALAGAAETLARFAPDLLVECNAIVMRRLHRRSHRDLFGVLARHYEHIYVVPDSLRDGTVVPLATADQLDRLLEFGRGNEDLFCTRTPRPALPVIDFDAWVAQRTAAMAGQQIVVEPNFQIVPSCQALEAAPDDIVHVDATLTNRGRQVLSSANPYPTHACYHVRAGDAVVVFDGLRTILPRPVGPGGALTFVLAVKAPSTAGDYTVDFTLVQEGIAWLDQLHVPVATVRLCVRPAESL